MLYPVVDSCTLLLHSCSDARLPHQSCVIWQSDVQNRWIRRPNDHNVPVSSSSAIDFSTNYDVQRDDAGIDLRRHRNFFSAVFPEQHCRAKLEDNNYLTIYEGTTKVGVVYMYILSLPLFLFIVTLHVLLVCYLCRLFGKSTGNSCLMTVI